MLLYLALACTRPDVVPATPAREAGAAAPLTPLPCTQAPAEGPAAADDAAFRLAVAQRADPGATADPTRRVFVRPGTAIAIATKDHGRVVSVPYVEASIGEYVAAGEPWGDDCLGVWLDPERVEVALDHTRLYAYEPTAREAAIEAARLIGRAEDQIAIYDFGTGAVIDVGGAEQVAGPDGAAPTESPTP